MSFEEASRPRRLAGGDPPRAARGGDVSGCTWPLAGRLEGRTCGRDLVSPRSSFCAAHHTMNRETTMGRREDLDEELDEDLDEAEELEDDDDEEPAPPRKAKASKAKAVPKPAKASQKGVPKPSPEETRALDVRIFDAADRLEAKLGRAPTHGEIAAAAKVPGASDGARFEASRRTLAAGGSRAEELEAIGRAEDERGWPRPEESLRAALGERLACGGLDVPRGFE